jgi:DNA-binding transcriptional regulator YdaS (Cro superfamily)
MTREQESKQQAILKWHRSFLGLYHRVAQQLGVNASYVSRVAQGTRRVAQQLGVNASYVSRVAGGKRQSEKIIAALVAEIEKIRKRYPE